MAMLGVIKNFANSEKAVAIGLLVIGATVLTGVGSMDVDQWMAYTKFMAGFYVGGKTIQGAAAKFSDAKNVMAENKMLKAKIAANDAAADSALDEKFPPKADPATRYAATPEG